MWTMLLLMWMFFKSGQFDGLPPEAMGCANFRDWWAYTTRQSYFPRPPSPFDVAGCRYFLKRDPLAFYEVLATAVGKDPRPRCAFEYSIPAPDASDLFWHDYGYRIYVARLLGDLGPPARDGVPFLKEMLNETDMRMRTIAVQALWKIERNADNLHVLERIISRRPPSVIIEAAPRWEGNAGDECPAWEWGIVQDEERTLFSWFKESPVVLQWGEVHSLHGLVDRAGNLRSWAMSSKCNSITTPSWFAQRLGFWCFSPSPATGNQLRLFAIEVLGDCGPSAACVAPVLRSLLQEPNQEIVLDAACALWKINQAPEARQALLKLFKVNASLWHRAEVKLPSLIRQLREEEEQN